MGGRRGEQVIAAPQDVGPQVSEQLGETRLRVEAGILGLRRREPQRGGDGDDRHRQPDPPKVPLVEVADAPPVREEVGLGQHAHDGRAGGQRLLEEGQLGCGELAGGVRHEDARHPRWAALPGSLPSGGRQTAHPGGVDEDQARWRRSRGSWARAPTTARPSTRLRRSSDVGGQGLDRDLARAAGPGSPRRARRARGGRTPGGWRRTRPRSGPRSRRRRRPGRQVR